MIFVEENARVPDGILKQHFDGKQNREFFFLEMVQTRGFSFSLVREALRVIVFQNL